MPSKIDRAVDRIAKVAAVAASAGLMAMTGLIVWQVFGRYVLNSSPTWSEAAALLALSYFVLLGAAIGVHEEFHLRLKFLVSRLRPRAGHLMYVTGQLLVGIFGLAMARSGVELVQYTSSHVIPALAVSRSIAYWPFVIGGGLIVLFAISRIVQSTRHRNAGSPWK